MSRKFGTTLAALAAFGALASSASAGDNVIRRDVQVSYSTSSITTEDGAKALLARIDLAARNACGGSPFFHPMYNIMPDAVTREFDKCYHDAVDKAVAEVNSPLLGRVYAEEKGDMPFKRIANR